MSKRRGMSLLEIMVTLGLIALMAVALGQGFQSLGRGRQGVRAEAEQLAELLRSLRQQAIAQSRPVGLGLAAAQPVTTGYYILEGETLPKIVRRKELPISLCGGSWPELSFVAGTGRPLLGAGYSLAQWRPPQPTDGLLMFLPSGEMCTNLPTFQGQVALVLGRAIRASRVAGGNEIQQVQEPAVIWCSALGEIRLDQGLLGAPGRAVAQLTGSPSATPPGLTRAANRNPTFVTLPTHGSPLQISPPPNSYTLGTVAPGRTGTLRLDRYVSLKVSARDPDGDTLYCRWTARGDSGRFTKQGEVKMHYEPSLDCWQGTLAWHSPITAAANDNYQLEAEVVDLRGGSARLSGSLAGGGNFQMLTPGKLAYSRQNDTWMSNWDGSDPVIVTRGLNRPRWSRGGRLLVCTNPTSASHELWIVSPDGRDRRQVYTGSPRSQISPGSFTTYNNEVCFVENTAAGYRLGQVEVWGDATQTPVWLADLPTLPPGCQPFVDCHPDGDHWLISTDNPTVPMLSVADGGVVTPLPPGAEASYNYTGTEILYRSAAAQLDRAPIAADGTLGASSASLNLSGVRCARFSRDGNYVVATATASNTDNCFLIFGGLDLTRPMQLFEEESSDPDWAD
jgi:prepilin-type N-terminal cleavage/methylation domain-containing protein